jgi:hypothetical protein
MRLFLPTMKLPDKKDGVRVLFLHHSTGRSIWNGGKSSLSSKLIRRINAVLGSRVNEKSFVQRLFLQHNRERSTDYTIQELAFPKTAPYGWHNYPFDYYNIWVKNGGPKPFLEEPTIEMLTPKFNVIVFKHCFPVSNIQPDKTTPDIDSDYRSLSNYKLQYGALREKLHQFRATKFIVWTAAAQVQARTNEEEAKRAKEFAGWVMGEWDSPDDNIFIWDFYGLQTEGKLYGQPQFAQSETNSHPNGAFSRFAAGLFFNRIVDVIESGGSRTTLAGRPKPN